MNNRRAGRRVKPLPGLFRDLPSKMLQTTETDRQTDIGALLQNTLTPPPTACEYLVYGFACLSVRLYSLGCVQGLVESRLSKTADVINPMSVLIVNKKADFLKKMSHSLLKNLSKTRPQDLL